jgi:lipoprotein-releasing system ATP-binding protein
VGDIEDSDSFARAFVDRPFRRHLGLATLRRRNRARCDFRFRGELCACASRGSTAARSYVARIKPMSAEPSLSCHDLERFLGEDESRVHALRGVSLQLEPGSVHAVVGPSGCGKSTLLYILGLLDHPDAGSVMLESAAVSHLPDDELARKRNEFIGFIFQFHFLMEDFTAQENVMIPMRRLGRLTEVDMAGRAAALLSAVGLGEKLERPSRHLSGGEQQRVAIARALANDPRVILADEPTGNLDTENSRRAFELLQGIVQQNQKALLLVTHNPAIAEACDWIHEMKDGRIVASHPQGQVNPDLAGLRPL